MRKVVFILTFCMSLFAGLNSGVYAQCAMCKSTIESNQKEQVVKAKKRAEGLNTGILYMMITPYILFGVLGYFWYKNSKKERAERARIESALKRALNN